MKKIFQTIGITGVIIITSVAIAIFSTSSQFEESMKPSIEDNSHLTDQLIVDVGNSDMVQVSESVEILKNNNNYIIDENGNKQYILNVTDSPTLED